MQRNLITDVYTDLRKFHLEYDGIAVCETVSKVYYSELEKYSDIPMWTFIGKIGCYKQSLFTTYCLLPTKSKYSLLIGHDSLGKFNNISDNSGNICDKLEYGVYEFDAPHILFEVNPFCKDNNEFNINIQYTGDFKESKEEYELKLTINHKFRFWLLDEKMRPIIKGIYAINPDYNSILLDYGDTTDVKIHTVPQSIDVKMTKITQPTNVDMPELPKKVLETTKVMVSNTYHNWNCLLRNYVTESHIEERKISYNYSGLASYTASQKVYYREHTYNFIPSWHVINMFGHYSEKLVNYANLQLNDECSLLIGHDWRGDLKNISNDVKYILGKMTYEKGTCWAPHIKLRNDEYDIDIKYIGDVKYDDKRYKNFLSLGHRFKFWLLDKNGQVMLGGVYLATDKVLNQHNEIYTYYDNVFAKLPVVKYATNVVKTYTSDKVFSLVYNPIITNKYYPHMRFSKQHSYSCLMWIADYKIGHYQDKDTDYCWIPTTMKYYVIIGHNKYGDLDCISDNICHILGNLQTELCTIELPYIRIEEDDILIDIRSHEKYEESKTSCPVSIKLTSAFKFWIIDNEQLYVNGVYYGEPRILKKYNKGYITF